MSLRRAILFWESVFPLSLLYLLAATSPCAGEAFRIIDQGASATGQGGAFSAQADDASTIHYNPAGISQLRGVQTSFGTIFVGADTSFSGTSPFTGLSVFSNGNPDGTVAIPPPSSFFLTANCHDLGINALDDVTLGLGLLSPFGLLVRYPNDGPFSTAVTFATLPLLDIKPTVAYKLNDQFAIGLGADIYTFASFFGEGQFELQRFNPPAGLGGVPGIGVGPIELNGTDTTAGYNLSLLYTPLRNDMGKPVVNVGLVYRSEVTLRLDGELLVNGVHVADTSTRFPLPDLFTAGVAVWPIRDAEH